MTTADLSRDPDPEKQPALVRVDVYDEWRRREGVPLVGGVYLRDMNEVEVGPWPRKGDGVKGALCYMDGDDETDEHIVELSPGGAPVGPPAGGTITTSSRVTGETRAYNRVQGKTWVLRHKTSTRSSRDTCVTSSTGSPAAGFT